MRSLLPNLILEGHSRSVLADYDYIARALVNPIDPNHAPRHPVIANIVASEARERAEVYCFDKHTTDIAWAMMNTRRRIRNVLQGVRLPFRRTFFEYETPPTRTGIFVEGDRNDCLISRIDTLNGMPDEPLLTMTLRHVDFDLLVERDDPVVDRVFCSYPVPGLENTSKLLWPEAMTQRSIWLRPFRPSCRSAARRSLRRSGSRGRAASHGSAATRALWAQSTATIWLR